MSIDISRRNFAKALFAAAAVPSITGCAVENCCVGTCAAAPTVKKFGKGQKVRLACVGLGNQAWWDINEFKKTNLCEFVALCDTDLDGPQCAKTLELFPKAKLFNDFRRMIDKMADQIDAVAIMTPDFSHFPALMAAMRAGLAVFVEKPLAHTFEECELLMAAEKKYGVVTQMGNQGHSGGNYYQFKEYVEKGIIDVSKLTRLVAYMNYGRRWHKWNGKVSAFPKGQVLPKGLDWSQWLGTADWHDFSRDYVGGEWRSWYDFGNGCLGDWGAHTMDTMHRFFQLGLPTEVKIRDVEGWNPFVFPMQDTLEFVFPACGNRPEVTLEWYEGTKNFPKFPQGFKAAGFDPSIPPGQGVNAKASINPGKFFELSDGTAWQGGSHTATLSKCGSDEKLPPFPKNGSNHYANFLKAVMGEEQTRSPFSVTAPLSEVFCLGCIAQRLNRGIKFDPATKTIVGDEVANALLKGSQNTPRRGWEEFYTV